jgi:cell division protein DivIC
MRKNIPSYLKNKYILVIIVAVVWFVFFDQNNLIQQVRLQRQLHEFNQEREYYLREIARDSIAVDRLRNNPEELERYAREKYLMKKANEEIFIVKE